MVRKSLFNTIVTGVKGVKSIAVGERNQAQLQIQQGQAMIYSQGAG